ncbi:MAG: hypothetical protein CR988_03470 [Treponema sp.]|nr:MAG: hypothetical protein CR988_03470 [Treponema sp.]
MDAYLEKVSKALEEKKQYLNNEELLKMRDHYVLQASATKGILDILLQKRLVHNDPYTYDSKMTEIELPEVSKFSDGEKASVIGTRLSHYVTMLEFLNTHYQFKCEFLNPKRISLLQSLNNVFLWDDFSDKTSSPNTTNLAIILEAIFNSPDKLSANLVRNSVAQMGKTLKSIRKIISELEIYQKEKYKLIIKMKVFPEIPDSKKTQGMEIIYKEIKKLFSSKFRKNAFYKNFIIEAIEEEFGPNAESLKTALLQKLASTQKQNNETEEEQETDLKPIIISGLKVLANSSTQLKLVLEKIEKNSEIIKKGSGGLFTKFIRLLRLAFNIKEPEQDITVVINDPITQSKKKHTINLSEFKNDLKRKLNIFQNISNPASQVHKKIQQIPEQDLFDSLNQYIQDCNKLLSQMTAIDQYYKTVKPELRSQIRGIKLEITAIKNSVINANQYRAEYSSTVEEEAQMKRLGI